MSITAKNFKAQLSTLVRSATAQRDKLQALVVFAIEHSKESGNFQYLDEAMNAIVPIKAFRTKTLKEYIKAHITNVKYAKRKDGEFGFLKVKKGVECEYRELKYPWYEHDNDGQATADVDVIARLAGFLKTLDAVSDGTKKVKAGQEAMVSRVRSALRDAMNAAPAQAKVAERLSAKA